jgi:hypothetical protein
MESTFLIRCASSMTVSSKVNFLKVDVLKETDLVARYAYFEIFLDESVRDDLCALFFGPVEDDGVYIWSPLFELAGPVLES